MKVMALGEVMSYPHIYAGMIGKTIKVYPNGEMLVDFSAEFNNYQKHVVTSEFDGDEHSVLCWPNEVEIVTYDPDVEDPIKPQEPVEEPQKSIMDITREMFR